MIELIKMYISYEWDLVSGSLFLIAIIAFILALISLLKLDKH